MNPMASTLDKEEEELLQQWHTLQKTENPNAGWLFLFHFIFLAVCNLLWFFESEEVILFIFMAKRIITWVVDLESDRLGFECRWDSFSSSWEREKALLPKQWETWCCVILDLDCLSGHPGEMHLFFLGEGGIHFLIPSPVSFLRFHSHISQLKWWSLSLSYIF